MCRPMHKATGLDVKWNQAGFEIPVPHVGIVQQQSPKGVCSHRSCQLELRHAQIIGVEAGGRCTLSRVSGSARPVLGIARHV